MTDKTAEYSRLVYSSDVGSVCPGCGQPVARCGCRKNGEQPAGDGIVRIRRESKGRGGKTVTVVSGVTLDREQLRLLAGELKRRCGTGGTVKGFDIEIQGDHADVLVEELGKRGFRVKRAGG